MTTVGIVEPQFASNSSRRVIGLMYVDDDSLAHYGVKGMKWGVRKDSDKGSDSDLGGGGGAGDDELTPEELEKLLAEMSSDERKRYEEAVKLGWKPTKRDTGELWLQYPENIGGASEKLWQKYVKEAHTFTPGKNLVDTQTGKHRRTTIADKTTKNLSGQTKKDFYDAIVDGKGRMGKDKNGKPGFIVSSGTSGTKTMGEFLKKGYSVTPGQNFVDTKKPEAKHSDLRTGEYLEQYGVRGMKWGFRKPTTHGGTPPSNRNAKVDDGDTKKTPSGKKSVKTLSDQQLKERIQRLQNEKLYKQLTAKPENVVVGIIKRSAKNSAETALTAVSTTLLKKALGKGAAKLLSKPAKEKVAETKMEDFQKLFEEAKKTAPKFKMPETPKTDNSPGTAGNPIFFTATRSDPTPRPTITLKELTRG